MRRGGYTPEQIQWLRDTAPTMSVKDLWLAFNDRFEQLRTLPAIKSTMKREGIRNGRPTGGAKGTLKLFTQEQMDFIRENYGDMGRENVTDAINRTFGTDFTCRQVTAFIKNHQLYSARTGHFQPGHVPFNKGVKGWQAGGRAVETQFKKGEMRGAAQHNYQPIGSTRLSKDGYLERKITDDHNLVPARRWVGEHRLVWENANGPIPNGHVIVFLDGNKANCSPENLRCVPRGVLQYINKTGLNRTTGEARKAAILTAEVLTRANQRERA